MINAPSSSVARAGTWELPSRGRVGMLCLILGESAVFIIFVVAYLFYVGKSLTGPTPREVLRPPIFFTICLLASSPTVHLAVGALRRAEYARFRAFWLLTILLGATFIYGTATEWRHLIEDEGLTLRTNLFGTTFYSLVGLHALHVIVGLSLLSLAMAFHLSGRLMRADASRVDVLSLYWHFVDVVWIVVFSVVYLIGR